MSVTAAAGFRASGVAAGITRPGILDLALVVNDGPEDVAAGVFTTNRVKAAPVLWSQQVLRARALRAVVLNSGGANACTGSDGFADSHVTAEQVAAALGLGAAQVAVCSTGLIGERLRIGAITAGVGRAAEQLADDGDDDAARAIMTTDTVPKTAVRAGRGWTVGGMAKGAGMLAPGLATLLCVITTDAGIDAATAESALRAAAARTFERVDSDGCMSTNDTVLLMASGAAGVRPDPETFADALREVCHDLAQQLLADAEGATKRIAITAIGAATEDDALEVTRAVARSALLKCAMYGEDPNWGRVLSAVGTTGAVFEPDRLDVVINGIRVCAGGAAGEPRELVDLAGREVDIDVHLHAGDRTATVWTTDLTEAYVHENSAYSS